MKKIILSLMLMVSVSFAYPTYVQYNGNIYKYMATFSWSTTPSEYNALADYEGYKISLPSSGYINLYLQTGFSDGLLRATRYQYFIATDCASPKTVVNGQCVIPDSLDCDPTKGTFTNLDGSCTDCSSHLFDTDVSGVAGCACGAKGATYTPSGVTGEVSVQGEGNSTSTQSSIKCSDGSSKYVYYNKKIPTDTNASIPTDNNNTNDNNTSVPTDNNGTKDGNGTIPNDGNGTKDGNGTSPTGGIDYRAILRDILQDTHSITGGINGDHPLNTDSNHLITSDTSAANWDTYSDTWSRLTDSFNDVSNKSNELKNLFENGFSSPFTKSSISTCRYQSSFEFGNLGVIPVDFDLCHIFSPLRPVIYTFAYLFFVFYILVFCVKMFFRLV